MENKAHALAAGIFVVVVSILLLGLAAWLSRDTGERHVFEISTNETVTGLQPQAPVRYRGVDVGKVAEIGFDPVKQGNVLMRLEIDEAAPVTRNTFATLSFQGVTGLAFVQLDDTGEPSPRLEPDDGAPPRIPLQPGLMSKLQDKGEKILDQVEQVTSRLNQVLDDPNQQRLVTALDNVGQAATSVADAASGIGQMSSRLTTILDAQLGPDRVSIPAFVKNANATLESLRGTSDEAKTTVAEMGDTMRRLNAADGPIHRLAEGAEGIARAADTFSTTTLPRINRVAEDTSRAVRQLGRTVTGIDDNPQSLIFGEGAARPGPGEPGFTPPGGSR